jgi:hypothetical protein
MDAVHSFTPLEVPQVNYATDAQTGGLQMQPIIKKSKYLPGQRLLMTIEKKRIMDKDSLSNREQEKFDVNRITESLARVLVSIS